MIKLRDLLFELDTVDKNVLYHSTDLDSMKQILNSKKIIPKTYRELQYQINTKQSGVRAISLTRNLKFAKNWLDCILVIDRNKLQQNFKIIPFSAFQRKSKLVRNEFEEFVTKPIGINYIKKILLPNSYKGLFNNIEIPIEYY